MLVAKDNNGEAKIAWVTEKKEAPFYCPECEEEVRLRKGKVRTHHFAHIPPVTCQYGVGESEIHLKAKKEIYEALLTKTNCEKCALERNLDGIRPDISLYINNIAVAIEIQNSKISIDEIYRRMSLYTQKKIYVLWVIPISNGPKQIYRENEGVFVHRLLAWEKYLHALYFGNIFYWHSQDLVTSYHFDKFKIYKEHNEWYSSTGDLESAGGYDYTAKALKTVKEYPDALSISKDFQPIIREEFYTDKWKIGKFRIYQSKKVPWW